MEENQNKNIEFYNQKYKNIDIEVKGILKRLDKLYDFLNDSTTTDTSWVGLYINNFRNKIKDKRVLELGCGDCANAAIMAALGAEVHANDIAPKSGEIIKNLNAAYSFPVPIKFIEGDFLNVEMDEDKFDYIVGKAFLHHLTHSVERRFLKKISIVLKPAGEARFFEPAVNSKLLDNIRWYFPVPGRPSKFNKSAFGEWREKDPHPERNNSSNHYEKVGKEFFREVEISPLGSLERFHRILPKGINNRKFRRTAFKMEKKLPDFLNRVLARSHTIIYRK